MVAADRRAYLDSLAQAAAARDFRNPKELYQALRKAFPAACAARRSRLQPLPMLVTATGEPAVTSEDRATAWRTHFASQESGTLVSADHYARDLRRLKEQSPAAPFDLAALPTLCKAEQVVLALRYDKAAGPDRLTSEMLRLHVPTTTRQLFPVIAKTVLRVREPAIWRGGELFVLAKRAGAALTCDAFRSIMVTSIAGKVMHRCLRDDLKPILLAHQPPLQGGVRPGLGIETPILAVKTFVLMADAVRQPWSVAFVDLQAAFYSVIRQSLVDCPGSDREYLALLHTLQVPSYAVAELKQHLIRLAELPRLGVNPHTVALVRDLFTGSWFRLSGCPELVCTQRGSRPGDPAADILFAFTLTALFRHVNEVLSHHGLCVRVPSPAQRPEWAAVCDTAGLGNPAWADDFVVPQTGGTPDDLLDRTCLGLGVLYSRANCLGMRIKFGREKTAVLLAESSRRALHRRFEWGPEGECHLSFQDPCDGTWHQVPVVQSYRHLGGILTSPITPVPDLHFRYSRAEGTARPLRKVLFSSQRFTLAVRRNLLSSLVLSRYLHSSAALVLRCAAHRKLWERHYLALWRNLFRRLDKDTLVHPFEVLHGAKALTPPLALAKARAAFLAKLVRDGPAILLALLCDHWLLAQATSWLGQLDDDIQYVSLYVPLLRTLLDARVKDTAVPQLIAATREAPNWWQTQIAKAEKLQHAELQVCAQLLRERREHPGSTTADAPAAPSGPDGHDAEGDRPYTCELCGASFRLRKHLCLHAAKAHKLLSPARHFAITEWCTACHRFYSIGQVQQHLKHSPACLRRCVDLHPPLSATQIQQLERPGKLAARRLRAGVWQSFSGTVPIKVPLIQGPFLPTADERQELADEPSEKAPLSSLRAPYVPKEETVRWIESYICQKSTEGPRQAAVRYWQTRPAEVLRQQPVFHQNSLLARILDAPE